MNYRTIMWLLQLSVATLLLSLRSATYAQERPNESYQTNNFNRSTIFRQNVCDLHRRYARGDMTDLTGALDGFELRTNIAQNQYFRRDDTGAIDGDYPGLAAVLLDELARNAGFTWRSTYTVRDRPAEGETWTDLLHWSVDTYDVSVGWWVSSASRLGRGVNFMESWYDASIIMVGKNQIEHVEDVCRWDAWTVPFAPGVWYLIIATIVVSCLTYMLLDTINKDSDSAELGIGAGPNQHLGETLFLTALAATSQFDLSPRTHPARLFAFSLSFWAMMITAAYTANLASFLVVKNTPPHPHPGSMGEAVRRGLHLCVAATTAADLALVSEYPYANIIRKGPQKEVFEGLLQGECDVAVTTVSEWGSFERDASVNDNCNLEWIGRVFRNKLAGFTTRADSGILCTSFIEDVLDYHLFNMREAGFIDRAWSDYLARIGTIDCERQESTKQTEGKSAQLNLQNMGGIFILHITLSCVAVIAALMYKCYGRPKTRGGEEELDRVTIGSGLVDKDSSKEQQMEAIKAIQEQQMEAIKAMQAIQEQQMEATKAIQRQLVVLAEHLPDQETSYTSPLCEVSKPQDDFRLSKKGKP